MVIDDGALGPMSDHASPAWLRALSDAALAAMAQPLHETSMLWTCSCTNRQWNHYEWCEVCGKARPTPPPETPPSNTPLADLTTSSTEGMDCGLHSAAAVHADDAGAMQALARIRDYLSPRLV